MLGPQDSIFQHLLEPEAGPEGGITITNKMFPVQRAIMLYKILKKHGLSFKTEGARALGLHSLALS